MTYCIIQRLRDYQNRYIYERSERNCTSRKGRWHTEMDKIVEVLEIKEDSNLGLIAGCRAPELDGMDEAGISRWFEEYKKLAFDNGVVIEFSGIIPFASACFGNGCGQAVLRLANASGVMVRTPSKALLQ